VAEKQPSCVLVPAVVVVVVLATVRCSHLPLLLHLHSWQPKTTAKSSSNVKPRLRTKMMRPRLRMKSSSKSKPRDQMPLKSKSTTSKKLKPRRLKPRRKPNTLSSFIVSLNTARILLLPFHGPPMAMNVKSTSGASMRLSQSGL
jgi:hypothetical protein